jgi:hypothetical protein
MKYGFLNGHKVAECQDTQLHLMARFKRERVVDEWRDSDAETKESGPANSADGQPENQAAPAGGSTGDTDPQEESGNGGDASPKGKQKPPTKAELTAEAQALGIALTGKEKNADIAAQIEAAKAAVAEIFPEDPQEESGNGGTKGKQKPQW